MSCAARRITQILSALILLTTICAANTEKEEGPNIIVILADDLGYGDLGCYNAESKIPTPNLDALATKGVRFTDAHAGGYYCVPSRYALMTGTFASRTSMNLGNGPLIRPGQPTVASVLRENGYQTAMVGKWHLGFDAFLQGVHENINFNGEFTGGPVDCGFHQFFGIHASLDIPPYFFIRNRKAVSPPTESIGASEGVDPVAGWNNIQGPFWRKGWASPVFDPASVTPRFFEEARAVISKHEKEASGKPLFLYLALPSPHTPWLPLPEFRAKSGAGSYGDFVVQVDAGIGQLLALVDESSLADNCLILFSSDNGPVWYDANVEQYGHRSCGPLRGMKGSELEGGHRGPFIVRWTGRCPAGITSDRTVDFTDLLPTISQLCGGQPESGWDGASFLSVLQGKEGGTPRPAIVHTKNCIRDGKWKLIRGTQKTPPEVQLYDLVADLGEKQNVAKDNPAIVARLTDKLDSLIP
jgi:arylsulfatase A